MANKQEIIDALNKEYNETLVWDRDDDWNLGVREGIRTAINYIKCLWDQHGDTASVIHKEWKEDRYVCPYCGEGMPFDDLYHVYLRYCPWCGVKLDRKDDDSATD